MCTAGQGMCTTALCEDHVHASACCDLVPSRLVQKTESQTLPPALPCPAAVPLLHCKSCGCEARECWAEVAAQAAKQARQPAPRAAAAAARYPAARCCPTAGLCVCVPGGGGGGLPIAGRDRKCRNSWHPHTVHSMHMSCCALLAGHTEPPCLSLPSPCPCPAQRGVGAAWPPGRQHPSGHC